MKLFTLLLALLCTSPALALRVRWNAPTTNEDGTELLDLAAYRIAVVPVDQDANNGGQILFQARIFITKYDLTSALAALPAGSYKIQVAAIDYSGNQGQYSEPLIIDTRPTPPAVVTNVRVY